MGKLGDFVNKAKDMARSHPDKTDSAVERAKRMVQERTGHRHDEQISRGTEGIQRSYRNPASDEEPRKEQ